MRSWEAAGVIPALRQSKADSPLVLISVVENVAPASEMVYAYHRSSRDNGARVVGDADWDTKMFVHIAVKIPEQRTAS